MNRVKSHHKKCSVSDKAGDEFISIPALDKEPRMVHAFTTRRDGLGARTNGMRQPDDWEAVASAFGLCIDRVVTADQVHGENIVTVDDLNFRDLPAMRADALITSVPRIAVGVETADCVPVLLFDPVKPAVAAV